MAAPLVKQNGGSLIKQNGEFEFPAKKLRKFSKQSFPLKNL